MTDQNGNNKEIGTVDPTDAVSDDMKERLLAEAKAAESVEQAQLHDLVEVAMGMKERKLPAAPEPENIERITTNQIKNMRQVSAKRVNEKEPFTDQLMQGVIKIYFGVTGLFSAQEKNSKNQCAIDGHQCSKCGQKFAVDAVKPVDPIKALDER